jgi:NADPH:quinone reductase-like Zn-dependent oxidoreductase
VVGKPASATWRDVQVHEVWSVPDAHWLAQLAQEVAKGELIIPISKRFGLAEIREAQTAAEKGASGKVLLTI